MPATLSTTKRETLSTTENDIIRALYVLRYQGCPRKRGPMFFGGGRFRWRSPVPVMLLQTALQPYAMQLDTDGGAFDDAMLRLIDDGYLSGTQKRVVPVYGSFRLFGDRCIVHSVPDRCGDAFPREWFIRVGIDRASGFNAGWCALDGMRTASAIECLTLTAKGREAVREPLEPIDAAAKSASGGGRKPGRPPKSKPDRADRAVARIAKRLNDAPDRPDWIELCREFETDLPKNHKPDTLRKRVNRYQERTTSGR